MNPERWRRIEEIYQAASEREPRERGQFVAESCGGDLAMKKEVESLLASLEKAGPFLTNPALGEGFRLELPDADGTGAPCEVQEARACDLRERAMTLRAEGHIDQAIEEYDGAISIYRQLLEERGRSQLLQVLADTHNNRAVALDEQGRIDEAVRDYDEAIGLYARLVRQTESSEPQNDLAMALSNRAVALRAVRKLDEAIADCDQAIEIRTRLVEVEGHSELRENLAGSLNNRATFLRDRGKISRAMEDYDRAIHIYAQLVESDGRKDLSTRLEKTRRLRAALES